MAYAIVGWLLIEVAATMLPIFEAPGWILQVFTFFVMLGFPIALVLSWIYDLTPQGLERTSATAADGVPAPSGRKLNYAIVGLLVVAVGFMFVDNYLLVERPPFAGAEVDPASLEAPIASPPLATAVQPAPGIDADEEREVLPNSVAVLPFENLSPDPNNAYFAAGVHEEVLNQLAKLGALNVISRTSMLRYADTDMSIPEIAAELNVETVMEGSVRYADGRVLVTAQLIDPATDVHLWSESFNREFADIFTIQSDIAMNIANALQAEFSVAEQESLAARPTDSPAAYALYLRAITTVEDPSPSTEPELMTAMHRDLDRAIELDPDFADPHAYKALLYATTIGGLLRPGERPTRSERAELAREHAERALELDSGIGLAHSALARVHESYLRRAEAAEAYERAYALSPNARDLLIDYANFMSKAGRPEDAIRLARRLAEVAPGWGHFILGLHLAWAGELEEALSSLREAVSLMPDDPFSHSFLGHVEATVGNEETALTEFRIAESLLESRSGNSLIFATLAEFYGVRGQGEDARRLVDRLEAIDEEFTLGAATRALAHLAMSEVDSALDWLRQAADDPLPDEGLLLEFFLAGNIYFDPVLEQPEFVEVRERLGFQDL